MNQILSTNNNYNNNYDKTDTKKIIIIFSIAVIIIACLIIAVTLMSNNKEEGEYIIPTLEIVRQDEREAKIIASCLDGIDSITYTWNNEKENIVNLGGSTTFERIISIPANSNNTLKVEITSSKGKIITKQEDFQIEIDLNKPTIDVISVVGSTLHIEASDDSEISYLIYQWEDEDEHRIEADEINNKNIITDINIQRGTYKLTVKVFDKAGNKEEVSKLITGVKQPEINVIKYGDIVRVTITHDMGFKRIEYLINGVLYVYDENFAQYDKDKTMVEFDFPLQLGENIVKVKAYSFEKLSDDNGDELTNFSSKVFSGKCTYEVEQ